MQFTDNHRLNVSGKNKSRSLCSGVKGRGKEKSRILCCVVVKITSAAVENGLSAAVLVLERDTI